MFQEIQEKADKFSEYIYYEPLSEDEVSHFEMEIKTKIPEFYKEFLLTFGFVQDVCKELQTSKESFIEDVDFLNSNLPDYFPIKTDIGELNTIYIIKKDGDEMVYKIYEDETEKLSKLTKYKPFRNILESSLQEIENNLEERCPNTEKINCYEFKFEGKDYENFIEIFRIVGLEQKTKWKPKYYPENYFGDEVATFTVLGIEVELERNEDKSEYHFEIDEPILTVKKNSIVENICGLLKAQRIAYEKEETLLIET